MFWNKPKVEQVKKEVPALIIGDHFFAEYDCRDDDWGVYGIQEVIDSRKANSLFWLDSRENAAALVAALDKALAERRARFDTEKRLEA